MSLFQEILTKILIIGVRFGAGNRFITLSPSDVSSYLKVTSSPAKKRRTAKY